MCPNWSYPRTGVFAFSNNILSDARLELPQNCMPELELPQNRVYLHLVIIYYLTQDWSYPRTACPNWSYPRTGVFAFSNNYIYSLTQDWSYPGTACPNWSYPQNRCICI